MATGTNRKNASHAEETRKGIPASTEPKRPRTSPRPSERILVPLSLRGDDPVRCGDCGREIARDDHAFIEADLALADPTTSGQGTVPPPERMDALRAAARKAGVDEKKMESAARRAPEGSDGDLAAHTYIAAATVLRSGALRPPEARHVRERVLPALESGSVSVTATVLGHGGTVRCGRCTKAKILNDQERPETA